VARIVHASTSSVKRWKDKLDEFGSEGLEPHPHPGRTPFLTARQKQQLVSLLEKGPLASGYHTDRWTCHRVADVIERQFDVTYHAGDLLI
jgi:transposase